MSVHSPASPRPASLLFRFWSCKPLRGKGLSSPIRQKAPGGRRADVGLAADAAEVAHAPPPTTWGQNLVSSSSRKVRRGFCPMTPLEGSPGPFPWGVQERRPSMTAEHHCPDPGPASLPAPTILTHHPLFLSHISLPTLPTAQVLCFLFLFYKGT